VPLILLLTATINPRDCSLVTRSDPTARLADYILSMRRWLAEPSIRDIVLCENSGSSLDDVIEVVRAENKLKKNVTFLSYASDGEGRRGKGYGELGILQHAISACGFPDSQRVLKVTGRYYVTNIDNIIDNINSNSADILSCPFILPGWIASECFCCTVTFLKQYFCPKRALVDDSLNRFFEQALAQSVKEATRDGLTQAIFSVHPQLEGISGGSGVPWKETYFASAPVMNSDGSITIRNRTHLAIIERLIHGYLILLQTNPDTTILSQPAAELLAVITSPLEREESFRIRSEGVSVIKKALHFCLQSTSVDELPILVGLSPDFVAKIKLLFDPPSSEWSMPAGDDGDEVHR
jgi:hypothetical protein